MRSGKVKQIPAGIPDEIKKLTDNAFNLGRIAEREKHEARDAKRLKYVEDQIKFLENWIGQKNFDLLLKGELCCWKEIRKSLLRDESVNG